MSTDTPKTPAKKTATKKPATKVTAGTKAATSKKADSQTVEPQRIDEVGENSERVVEQAPEVSNISLPAIPVSLTSSSVSEASMRAVLSGGVEALASPGTGEILIADIEEVDDVIVVEEFENVDTGSLPSRRDRNSGETASRPEPVTMLTPERVLDGNKKRDAPSEGWRKAVYAASFHAINLGDSPAARERKAIDQSIGRMLTGGTKFVPVLTRKGGVGKTTTTTLIGMAMSLVREDRVLAIDANPDRGTLAERFERTNDCTVRDLVANAAKILTFNDFSQYVSRDRSRLDVLASDTDPFLSEAFGANDYNVVADLASRYYTVALTDCGTGIVHSVMGATLQRADQIVIVSGGSFDEARLASETLTWLESNGYGHLVKNAIVAINTATQGTNLIKLREIEDHFKSRVRDTVRVPYDAMLAAGSYIDFKKLKPETQEAARQLASLVVDGLK
ncbi:MinD-like ATPase involved in chromosome partitioning or flagellar assembly [Aurantimicrobium minutum]|uniref:MinD/ParA family ATP-binding protein n=1 Tax=Aurantimicrobium minutum TaxID=708131 RepID=UPI0024734623|nr:AAA family ATPase [Aurantimicrobium minutum]MDH6532841.1 MinD-like ATPase involved in chromosome partitioning or flagellar assembly [Aurantimicrobium minutum]